MKKKDGWSAGKIQILTPEMLGLKPNKTMPKGNYRIIKSDEKSGVIVLESIPKPKKLNKKVRK